MKTLVWHFASSMVVLILLSPSLMAEVRVVEDFGDEDGHTLYKMTVTPAAEPTPALKHRLQLRSHELKPGNAATYYLRANADNGLSGVWKGVRKEFGEAVDEWYRVVIPLSELPLDKVRKAASRFNGIVSDYIVPASYRQDCDWGYNLTELRGSDVYAFPLPGAQQSRSISRMLALRTRLAIAEGRYGDAIDHIRMNYRLARNVGKSPIFVCGLIGIAAADVTNRTALDLIAAPDSPNLYWALTELPRPLVDMREAVRLEMSIGTRLFSPLIDVESTEHSPEEWARLIADELKEFESLSTGSLFKGVSLADQDLLRAIAGAGLSMLVYPDAKQRLIQSGMDAEYVEKIPVGQVVLIDAAREYQRIADEAEKWLYIPYPLAKKQMRRTEDELSGKRNQLQGGLGPIIADILLPPTPFARRVQIRLEWKMAALRVIEALRMHAAETGKFPKSLDEIEVVPVPLNPITTKPYLYHLDGQTAVLELPFSDGMPGVAYRYEITLAEP